MKQSGAYRCRHSEGFVQSGQVSGVALVSIGNSLRADDGVGAVLTAGLSADLRQALCIFDLGLMTSCLAEALNGHRTALIIDAVHATGSPSPGQVHVAYLSGLFENTPLSVGGAQGPGAAVSSLVSVATRTSHGISWLEELSLVSKNAGFPERLYFFGVEAADDSVGQDLSRELSDKLPVIQEQLSHILRRELSRG